MPTSDTSIAALHAAASACADAVRSGVSSLSDDALLEQQRAVAAAARLLEVAAAGLAAEIGHRSRRELGYQGLAQKRGARTPEALVQQVTGGSLVSARRLVRVGTMVAGLDAPESPEPWLSPVLRAASLGVLSAEAVEAVRVGLGSPTESVSADALAQAARTLAAEASTATVDRLARRARELRDDLDLAGVALRETQLRDKRFLRLVPQVDGMTRLTALLDPESAAIIGGAIDAATSPRRGGPRFVDPDSAAAAEALLADERTTEQIALDALIELVDAALRSTHTSRLGARRPDVRVLVTQRDLDRRCGIGYLEGQSASVSLDTVERLACDGGLIPILFDDNGQALNLGRSQRLHNQKQRIAIATRDGGCIAPECDRPPAWTEVHHINEFGRGGLTDVADGVLLCRHHHMLVHNNRWRIKRHRDDYRLIPPPEVDPLQTPILLASKSPAIRRMLATA
ncbi:hypothetical protein BH10ACT7_BH10ACT7_14280 [soil metagenome]